MLLVRVFCESSKLLVDCRIFIHKSFHFDVRLNLIKCALVQGFNELANDFTTLLVFGTADSVNNC